MSLAINTTTPEGIVLAADSRQSYRNQKNVSRIGSDSASKLFLINNRIGVATTGLAFLQENGIPKNISKFIEQFKRETGTENLLVKEAADKLHSLFDKKLNWQEQLDKLPDQIRDNLTKQGLEVIEVKKEQYKKLPKSVREKAKERENIFRVDPFHPILNTHKLHGKDKEFWAFYIDFRHRVKFVFLEENAVLLMEIGGHDIYK